MKTPIEEVLTIAQQHANRFAGNLSEEYGLMPQEETASKLTPELRFIDRLVDDLPRLYRRGQVCRAIMELPIAHASAIERLSDSQKIRLSICYGLLSYSFRFAWEDALEGKRLQHLPPVQPAFTETQNRDFHSFDLDNTCVKYIARNVILPWKHLWEHMGLRRPYFESALFTQNFRLTSERYDSPEVVSQFNAELLFKFFATDTERFFFLGVQEVTGKFNCVPVLISLQRAMITHNDQSVVQCCEQLTTLWRGITEDVFMRFDTRIDPIEWGSSVGKWTASPFYKQEGFSGMFFPAFHILDLLIGRVNYDSFLGDLILKTREILPPNWQRFFQSVAELNLKDYVAKHAHRDSRLASSLVKIQDLYQLFFQVHRRKIFSFEYQAILTGRNSTNAGISVEVKTHQDETVYDLATWNNIDDILLESGNERPLENLGNKSKCPFSSANLATEASKSYPPTVATQCPFSGDIPSETKEEPQDTSLIQASWIPLHQEEAGFHGILIRDFPLTVSPGDRCLIVDQDGERHEGEFVGRLDTNEHTIRTLKPIQKMDGIKLLPGIFQRPAGEGPNAQNTASMKTLVICQGDRSMISTTLAAHSTSSMSVLLVGSEVDTQRLRNHGCDQTPITQLTTLQDIKLPRETLEQWARNHIYTLSGDTAFVRQSLKWIVENLKPANQSDAKWLSNLREKKSLRIVSYRSATPANRSNQTFYPWDLLTARSTPRYVALRNRVIDITTFQHIHLGGANILRLLSGVDITDEFGRAHPGQQVSLPDALEIGSYTVPTPLRIMTNYASKLVRSANVIELQLEKLAIYETVPSVYRQRALSTLSAIDISILWKPEGFQKPLNETEVRSLVQRMHTRLEPLNSNDSAPPALQVKQLLKELLSCLEMTIKNLCQCLASQHKSTSKSEHRILASH
ncbi:cytochrome b5 domain-containing protein, partial [bacterium]|nr:cytochrome b5 domain-containing protein [bacterium]